MYADLHIHTTHTDGSDDPVKILQLASECGLNTIAITDHDTVEGVREARKHSIHYNVNLINGVELTTKYNDKEIHILGYHLDINSPHLDEYFCEKGKKKTMNTQLNFARAIKNGIIKYSWDRVVELNPEVSEFSGINVIFAMNHDKCIAKNYISNWDFYRDYFCTNENKLLVTERKTPYDAIHIIKKCGGVPILAHPASIGDDRIVEKFLTYGVLGIEVFHNTHLPDDSNRYLKLAKKYNMFITGGSGWYGNESPKNKTELGIHGLEHSSYGILRVENKRIIS